MASVASASGSNRGTAPYMAPEQFDSATFGRISPKTDMWALGCVVIEMITGQSPWPGKRYPEIMMSVGGKGNAPAIPATLPGGEMPVMLDAILRGCLTHEQAKRPSAASVVSALHPLGGGAL